MNTLFAGAYLSELFKEKELKISNMKVGSSPLYYLEGQEELLGNFTQHLPSKEKEAHDLLKKQGTLEDSKQTPAIRVALRNIKDFAIPYKIDDKIIWRYMVSEKPLETIETPKPIPKPTPRQKKISKPKVIVPTITAEQLKEQAEKEIEKELIEETGGIVEETKSDIIEEIEIEEEKPKSLTKKPAPKPKKITPKDKFLQQIKSYLEKKGVDIIEIEKHDKKQIAARVKIKDQAYLLMAYNKKRFDEADLLKAYRKYADEEIPFYFLSKGELSKKTEETIRAAKQLKAIGIFEE